MCVCMHAFTACAFEDHPYQLTATVVPSQQLEVYIHSTSVGQCQKYIDTSNVTISTYGFWNQLAFAQVIIWFPCMAIKPRDYCLSHPAIIANVALSLRVVIIL